MDFALRPALFWDSDIRQIDLQKNRSQVIERILTRGRWEEFRAMLQFYGRETVRKVALEARWLDRRTLAFCAVAFDVSETEFRCYKLAQLNPEHWDF